MRGGALTTAYSAMSRGDHSNLSAIIQGVDQQRDTNPDDPYGYFYAGVFRLWAAADTDGTGLLAVPDVITGTLSNLATANERLPDDFRASGFYGMSQIVLGGDVEGGLATLQKSIDLFPEYGHFLRGFATASLASTDPTFLKYGPSDMEAITKDCMLETDASGAWVYPKEGHPKYGKRVCTNSGIVPHVWEGWFMTFGDLAVKAGWTAERASAAYRTAKSSPTYDQWPFKNELEQRISNLADGNPANEVQFTVTGMHICSTCHKEK
jgi:hypothetical protein